MYTPEPALHLRVGNLASLVCTFGAGTIGASINIAAGRGTGADIIA